MNFHKLRQILKESIFIMYSFLILSLLFGCTQDTNKSSYNIPKSEIVKLKANNLKKADSLLNSGNLLAANNIYLKEYQKKNQKELAYKLSSLYSISGKCDSAFIFLEKATDKDSSIYRLMNGSFISLIKEPLWDSIINRQFDKYQHKFGSILNLDLSKKLLNLQIKDQAYLGLETVIFPYKVEEYRKNKIKISRSNILEIGKIINDHGWPKKSEVALELGSTTWLIFQHAELEIQKKYLANLLDCVIRGEANHSDLAYLIDRINVREGRKQLYGTQISYDTTINNYVLIGVFDLQNLDYRRQEVGLDSIKNYLKHWGAKIIDEENVCSMAQTW